MAFKKLAPKLPPRLWILKGRSGDGKSHFSMQMKGPLLPIDSDRKLLGNSRHAVGEVLEFSPNHQDSINVARLVKVLDENMNGADVGTIILDSVTPILEPLIQDAMEKQKTARNNMSVFMEKASAIKSLVHNLHKWGTDVLWIYHIEDTVNTSGTKTERTSITATELARIAKSVNMSLTVVRDGAKRGIRVEYAQHGKYGMTIWDDIGGWKGMPELIEQAVYADGVLDTPMKPTTFTSPEEAITWGFLANCFRDAVHAKNAYTKLKTEKKPGSAAEMWTLWIADVDRRVAEIEAGGEIETEEEVAPVAVVLPALEVA